MLNERIRALRLAKGLTLQQVGDVFGISRASVSNWEAGHSQPDPRKIERLAKLFDTSVQFLWSGEHSPLHDGDKSTFAGVPFVSFSDIEMADASIESLARQSQKFLPTQFPNASRLSFCTNFPTPTEPFHAKLIPPGAIVFFDCSTPVKNQSIVLLRSSTVKADFFQTEISSSSLKLRSLTRLQAAPYTPTRPEEIIGTATGFTLSAYL
jgi:transcriptional regulator with XRE-family HTH domain